MSIVNFRPGSKAIISDYTGEVPEGKVFDSWNTRQDGTGISYKPGREIVIVDSLHLWPMFVDKVQEASE